MTMPRSEFEPESATPAVRTWLYPAEQGELHLRFTPESFHAFMQVQHSSVLRRPDGKYLRFEERIDDHGYITLRGIVSDEPFPSEIPVPESL